MGLLQQASLVVTPNAYKASKLYSVIPTNGTGDLDVVRATSATRVNSAGLIESVGDNIPRLDYTNATCPSILVEPQRTNLVFPSDIATTQTRTVTAVAHTLSFYGTGSVTLSGVATGTLNGTGANNRVTLTFTPTAGSLVLTITGSVTNWQLEAGANATSLIQTVSTSVTRNADLISKTGISSLIGQTEGTIYFETNKLFVDSLCGYVNISESTQNRILIYGATSTNQLVIQVRINNVTTAHSTFFIGMSSNAKVAFGYKNGDSALYINGVKYSTTLDTINYNFPVTLSKLEVMNYDGSNFSNGTTKVCSLFKTRLTNTQLQQLTTL